MSKKDIANSPWTVLTTFLGIITTGGTIGGMMGYDHVMEKFWHPVNDRLDRVIVQQKVLIFLGHTEDEISEAWHKAAVEMYEEKRAARLAELGLSEEDFE